MVNRGEREGEEPQSGEEDDGSGEYVDEEEVENEIVDGTPPAMIGQRTVPWGRKHIDHEPDEEDDELMMYAKVWPFRIFLLSRSAFPLTLLDSQDNPHRVRPSHENKNHERPRPLRRKSVTDVTAQQRLSSTNNAPALKRRTTETGPGGSARTKRRR
jgi:hypothetical protein